MTDLMPDVICYSPKRRGRFVRLIWWVLPRGMGGALLFLSLLEPMDKSEPAA